MKRIGMRVVALYLIGFAISAAAEAGWIDALVSSILGLVLYWALIGVFVLYMFLGVARPFFDHMSEQDSQCAKFLTALHPKPRRPAKPR